MFEPLLEEDH